MLENSTDQFRRFIEDILDEIDVPQSRYEQARDRYHSVAGWLQRKGSAVGRFSPELYSQGSFRLGTVIKPPIDEDYDIDLVCQLDLAKSNTTQKQLKKFLGDEIGAYATANGMNAPPKEGSRCWTLNYADGAQFHLDVLPCVPDAGAFRQFLLEQKVQASWTESAIAITDKSHPHYERISNDWLRSNPKGYAEWFKSRMLVELTRQKKILAEKIQAKVEDVPTWRVKTPLQRIVQLLKKHRDECFLDHPDDKPISIIITTLAAGIYQNEVDLIIALGNVSANLDGRIEKRGSVWWVPNPVNPLENFADRWAQFPERAEAFFSWTKRLREDLARAGQLGNTDEIGDSLYEAYGNTTVANILQKRLGKNLPAIRQPVPQGVSHKQAPPWKMALAGKAAITARIVHGLHGTEIFNDGPAMPKHKELRFKVTTNVQPPYECHWQVVNTGDEAKSAASLRGDFYDSQPELGHRSRKESTLYKGRHWVECFIVKNGVCVARTGEFFINIQ